MTLADTTTTTKKTKERKKDRSLTLTSTWKDQFNNPVFKNKQNKKTKKNTHNNNNKQEQNKQQQEHNSKPINQQENQPNVEENILFSESFSLMQWETRRLKLAAISDTSAHTHGGPQVRIPSSRFTKHESPALPS